MEARRAHVPLHVRPTVNMFRRGQEADLAAHLERVEQDTNILPLMAPSELILGYEGETAAGYKYTTLSFKEVCHIVCPGSKVMLNNLAGMTEKSRQNPELASGKMATDFFNEVMQLRFPLLESYRVIYNEKDQLIEGIVGSKQQILDNLTLFRQAQETIRTISTDVEFWSAAILGRKMLLWYRKPDPLFTRRLGEDVVSFYPGYYFCNGEARGTSVRGTAAIYTRYGVCLGPYDEFGGRLAHIGRDFHRRLDKMFGAVLSKELPVEELEAGCDSMCRTPLGYANLDKKARQERRQQLTRSLAELKVPSRIGAELVEDAALLGHDTRQPHIPAYDTERVFASRTIFDLFCRVVKTARKINTRRREVLERAGYQMLRGNFVS